ncbi:MAG: Gfo/Idh/MocA family oxidoreductase [Nitrospirota bacterium]
MACIGAGAWGTNLVRSFSALGALHTICERDPAVLQRAAKAYPDAKARDSYEAVLADPEVQAVAIASPAGSHAAMAVEALEAGKDVFVEKPLALTLSDGRHVVRAAERTSRILMVGHLLQYHPAVRALRDLVLKGDLGKVHYLYSTRLNIGKFRREENILWSFAPHDLSVILMLVGQMPATVQASGGTYLQHGVPDVTMTALSFPNGVKAHVFVSWLHPFKEQKLVVVGSRKMAVFDDLSKEKLLLYPHRVDWIDHAPVALRADAEVVPVPTEEPLAAECRHFLRCVERRLKPRTDGEEALRVLEVLEAGQASLDQGGASVRVRAAGQGERGARAEKPAVIPPGVWVHPTAVVDQPAQILSGTKVWHFSHVLAGSRIGADCVIGQNVVIGPNVTIGNRVKIQNNVSVYEGVTLEDFVFCGPSMVFTNVLNPRSAIPRKAEIKPTLVKRGATLGANCTVLCGVTVGRCAFVGAGAVVTEDVPDYSLVVGNPARRLGWICACGIKLAVRRGQAACRVCGAQYVVSRKAGCQPVADAESEAGRRRARSR